MKHGQVVSVGKKHDAIEITKGTVVVKVLDMNAAAPISGIAV